MTKHTPGPWTIKGSYIIGYPEANISIAHVLGNVGQPVEANAILIHAAPGLLEACELVEAGLSNDKPENPERQRTAMLRTLRAAIAKAKSA